MPQWVPQELNVSADAISNIVHFDDWFTTRWFFDRFANATYTHLPRFNSRFCVPGAEARDTFSVSRKGENNWLVPPVHYIIRMIQHLLVCGAVGILVAPYWPSNAFWPFLFASAVGSQPYVIASIYFSDTSRIFALRCYEDSLLDSDRFNSAVLPARIDARGLRAWRPSGFTLVHEF